MAFFRQRGETLALLHGLRDGVGVPQRVLYTFAHSSELRDAMEDGPWQRFCLEIEQKHPDVAPDWNAVRTQARKLLAQAPAPVERDQQERGAKLKRALRYAQRELARLHLGQEHDRETLNSIGPDLIECLRMGTFLLECARGRTPEMAWELTGALVVDNERLDATVERAQAALVAGDLPHARDLFAEARRGNPFDPDVDNAEGLGWIERRRYAQARECFARARTMARGQLPHGDRIYRWSDMEVRPYLRSTFNLGMACQKQGDFARALELFLECVERCPDDGLSARFHLGPVYHRLGQLDVALRSYRESLTGNFVDLPDPYFNGALALLGLERPREALEWMLQGLRINRHVPLAVRSPLRKVPGSAGYASVESRAWAAEYAAEQAPLWSASSRRFLKRVVQHFEVRRILEALDEIEDRDSSEPATAWQTRLVDPALAGRVAEDLKLP